KISRTDHLIAQQLFFYPLQESAPIFRTHQNNRKTFYFAGLDKGHSFKKLVHGAKASGHHNITLRILHEHYFTYKKILKLQEFVFIYIRIVKLFKGKIYI